MKLKCEARQDLALSLSSLAVAGVANLAAVAHDPGIAIPQGNARAWFSVLLDSSF